MGFFANVLIIGLLTRSHTTEDEHLQCSQQHRLVHNHSVMVEPDMIVKLHGRVRIVVEGKAENRRHTQFVDAFKAAYDQMCGQVMHTFLLDPEMKAVVMIFVRGLEFASLVFRRVDLDEVEDARWDLMYDGNDPPEDNVEDNLKKVLDVLRERYYNLEKRIAFRCDPIKFEYPIIDLDRVSGLSPAMAATLVESNFTQYNENLSESWFTDLAAEGIEEPSQRSKVRSLIELGR